MGLRLLAGGTLRASTRNRRRSGRRRS